MTQKLIFILALFMLNLTLTNAVSGQPLEMSVDIRRISNDSDSLNCIVTMTKDGAIHDVLMCSSETLLIKDLIIKSRDTIALIHEFSSSVLFYDLFVRNEDGDIFSEVTVHLNEGYNRPLASNFLEWKQFQPQKYNAVFKLFDIRTIIAKTYNLHKPIGGEPVASLIYSMFEDRNVEYIDSNRKSGVLKSGELKLY